jgi:7-dehydrocholesterol reductase
LNDVTSILAKCDLQSVFVAKFFWWEAGYFSTLDIILDRAGYYICWGCLVWVPCLYTFSSYYLVAHPPVISTTTALLIAMLGLFAILLNYRVDYEKQLFRRAPDGKCNLWGKPARFIEAQYKDSGGKVHTSKLLLTGMYDLLGKSQRHSTVPESPKLLKNDM